MSSSVFILGGSGFIGQATVTAAVSAGHTVLALARSDASAATLRALGATPVRGDATAPADWASELALVDTVIDLMQPPLPARLSRRAIAGARDQRLASTRALINAVTAMPANRRPLIIGVSSVEDLLPDGNGKLSGTSPLRQTPRGFAHIGIPVRAAVQASGLDAVFVYLGNTVYGPGKAYANIVDGIRSGSSRARIVGDGRNRLPLTHVDDAASALCHLLALDRTRLVGQTVVAAPATAITQRDLYAATADALGRPTPGGVPTILAALVAGAVSAETMTLDAICDPDLLSGSGFTFRHPTLGTGVPASISVMDAAVRA